MCERILIAKTSQFGSCDDLKKLALNEKL